jgi:hypothetical protein
MRTLSDSSRTASFIADEALAKLPICAKALGVLTAQKLRGVLKK